MALGEEVDFPFWDGCFRLGQAGKSDKKTSKNCIFSGKKFCGAIFVPLMIWPKAQHVPPRSSFLPTMMNAGRSAACRRRQGMKWKFGSEKWE
ncbi:hypothetical protein [Agrobacterium leguminum]